MPRRAIFFLIIFENAAPRGTGAARGTPAMSGGGPRAPAKLENPTENAPASKNRQGLAPRYLRPSGFLPRGANI